MKKYISIFSVIILTIIFLFIYKYKINDIDNLLEEQKNNLVSYYTSNIKTLFSSSDLTSDDIFIFAFNHLLPLDKEKNQFIKIGYDDKGKQYFELLSDINNDKLIAKQNFEDKLNLSPQEKTKLNSLLNKYKDNLTEQIIISENNALGLSENLWTLNKEIAADILNFTQDLNKNLSYETSQTNFDNKINKETFEKIKKSYKSNPEFIFITPDTIFSHIVQPKNILINNNPQFKHKNLSFIFNLDTNSQFRKFNPKRNPMTNISFDTNRIKIDLPFAQNTDLDSLFNSINKFQNYFNKHLHSEFNRQQNKFRDFERYNKLKIKIPNIDSLVKLNLTFLDSSSANIKIDSIIRLYNHSFSFGKNKKLFRYRYLDSLVNLSEAIKGEKIKITIPNIDSIINHSLKSLDSLKKSSINIYELDSLIKHSLPNIDSLIMHKTNPKKLKKIN